MWQRDGAQCTFVDSQGRRCGERHFLTIEHRQPFALGGPATVDNLCLLCKAHNLASARAVFGEEQIAANVRAKGHPDARHDPPATSPANAALALSALCRLGFPRPDAATAVGRICGGDCHLGVEDLLRESLQLLVPTGAKAA